MKLDRRKRVLFIFLLSVVLCLSSCGGLFGEKDYQEDLYIDVPGTADRILIKEWQYLLGSGQEIYYCVPDEKPVLLGRLSGSDDGYCAFADERYEVTFAEGEVVFRWATYPGGPLDRTDSFVLPQ